MSFDVASDFNIFGGLPKGTARRALDAEIAGEGGKVISGDVVILSNGDQVAWTPPPEKLAIPDLSVVKSLRHYFGQRGYQTYPAWLYHPEKPAALVRNAAEAAEYGIVYRQATTDERNRYGLKDVWDWEEGSLWRPNPYSDVKFDPKNPGSGKTVIYSAPDPRIAQHDLIAALIPAVAAAVAQSLKTTGPSPPANVDSSQWEAFLAFQAFQKAQEVVNTAAVEGVLDTLAAQGEVSETLFAEGANALSPEQDRMLWEEEAKRLGIEIDKRWSIATLRSKVEKAQTASGSAA